MSGFYSSLVINGKKFPDVHQVFRPRYNKEFFKRVTANIGQLEAHIDKRCKNPHAKLGNDHLKNLKESASQLVKLKDRLEKTDEDGAKYREVLYQIQSIEEKIMPTVTRIPVRLSKLVPEEEVIIEEVRSDFMTKQRLSKVLSHRKLSYINNCYSKSVVGPNSHYYFGIGAKLQNAISDYFTSELERERFVPVSGPSLVKSAVVEAANSSDAKEYFNDPARILTDTHKYVTLHLSEASRESLVGFLTTIGPLKSNDPLRLMTAGAGYKMGSDWFDGDDKRITQVETLHALILNSSIEQYSIEEYHRVRDIIWSSYKRLELPVRLVHCSCDSMHTNEYDAHRIDIWLPSRHDWFQVSRISHYLDCITIRVGMRRGHMIDSSVFDGQILAAAIIENKQTAQGKFIIPDALADHTIHLTNEERQNYFSANLCSSQMPTGGGSYTATQPKATVLNNHEQRRYLRKMEHPFGHSRKASALESMIDGKRHRRLLIGTAIMAYILIDWTDLWLDYTPDCVRSVLYDYAYRPVRRVWWYIVHPVGKIPPDTPYAQIDKTEYKKTMWQRKREHAKSERELPEEVRKAQESEKQDPAQEAEAISAQLTTNK